MNKPEFWKAELHREVGRLRRALEEEPAAIVAARSVTIERFAFITAFIMRKLDEADHLTLDVTRSTWPVLRFAGTVPPPHRRWFAITEDRKNWRQPLEQHYDLACPTQETLRFDRLCDRLVHHFAFEVRHDARADEVHILFNSDHTKDRLYLIMLSTLTRVVEEVAYDEVRWVDMSRAEGRVIQRRSRPNSE
jgi:hypothetical protein